MRLLICIAQAALDGPADEVDWEECEPGSSPRLRHIWKNGRRVSRLFGDGPRVSAISELATRARKRTREMLTYRTSI